MPVPRLARTVAAGQALFFFYWRSFRGQSLWLRLCALQQHRPMVLGRVELMPFLVFPKALRRVLPCGASHQHGDIRSSWSTCAGVACTESPAWRYQHGDTRAELLAQSSLHRVTSMEILAQSHQHGDASVEILAQSHQHGDTCTESPAWSHQHRVTCAEPSAKSQAHRAKCSERSAKSEVQGAKCTELSAQSQVQRAKCIEPGA